MTRLNRSLTTLLGIGALALAATSVDAHQPNRDDARTYRGYDSSRLTKGERKKLAKHRQRVSRARERALSDGRITRKEAKKIDKAQDKLARQRTRAMDDDTRRGYRRDRDDWRDGWTRDRWNRDRWHNTRSDRRGERRGYGNPWWRGWYGRHGHDDDEYGRHGRRGRHDGRDHRGWHGRRDRD